MLPPYPYLYRSQDLETLRTDLVATRLDHSLPRPETRPRTPTELAYPHYEKEKKEASFF